MADGEMNLRIDEALADRLRAAAAAAGESVDVYARRALEAFSGDMPDWDEVDRIASEAMAAEDGVPFEAVESDIRGLGAKPRA